MVEVGPEKARLPRSGEMSVRATRHSIVHPLGRVPSPPGGGGGHAGMNAHGKCLQREIKRLCLPFLKCLSTGILLNCVRHSGAQALKDSVCKPMGIFFSLPSITESAGISLRLRLLLLCIL